MSFVLYAVRYDPDLVYGFSFHARPLNLPSNALRRMLQCESPPNDVEVLSRDTKTGLRVSFGRHGPAGRIRIPALRNWNRSESTAWSFSAVSPLRSPSRSRRPGVVLVPE